MPRRKSPPLPIERATSAGGVVFRRSDQGLVEVLLCHRREPALWSLPKGTPDPGESLEETAIREVREETGVDPVIVGSLGKIRYWFSRASEGRRFDKTVHHFLMEPVGGDPSLHDHEFDEVAWLPLVEARARVTYGNEREVLDRAAGMLGMAIAS